ncbi:MAG: 4-hydroxythreonine-4-phosphate dehydrogenase PdxA [Eubacteriaceae bacterium]
MKPLIVIPMGDPAGIGPEIVVKALADLETQRISRPLVIGDQGVLEKAIEFSGIALEINQIANPAEGCFKPGILNLINLNNILLEKLNFGEVQGMAGKASYAYIKYATDLCLNHQVDAMATTAINKESLKAGKVPYIGHTEMIGNLTGTPNPLTMFQVYNLRVFFLTRHVSLKEACDLVKKEKLLKFIDDAVVALKVLGVENPRLAIAGLNPHSGEHGLFGTEEINEVIPAVEEAQNLGINIIGPIGADSVFHFGLKGDYDAVLSLYHDQGHIATKMVDFERTISITNGLPFLRTSVDHGTAFDIAGKGIASPVSMIEAIRLAVEYAPKFNNRLR